MKSFIQVVLLTFLFITGITLTAGQTRLPSERMVETAMTIWKGYPGDEPGKAEKWTYEQGVLLKGVEGVWESTGDGRYFKYIQQSMDRFVNVDGTIKSYKLEDYNIDNVLNGRILLFLYKVTGQEKYAKAASLLREQLKTQPRTTEGGFWHKKIYPSQMWLDGLYMGEPFYAEYAATFHEDSAFDDIANQFILMENHARDARTGLLYHGWDESGKQRWADPIGRHSPNFWGRAMGWYGMALVDVLDYFPKDHPKRETLIAILRRLALAIDKYQESKSGLWYQVLDKGNEKGNYLEASAASMFVYTLAKGVRQGYLPVSDLKVARKGFRGIQTRFLETEPSGQVNLNGTVSVAGLGGNPYRDGSYQYYLSEKVVTNDLKGMGAYLMASNEIEIAADQAVGSGKTVALDYFFNNELKKDSSGHLAPYYYEWEEMPNSGFSTWGNIFRKYGVRTEALKVAPTAQNLRHADVYIIVDPDTKEENDHPNFVEQPHIDAIMDWVRSGGVLVLMGNDVGNAEFDHFNQLAGRFGIRFNKDSKNRVQGNDFAMGKVQVPVQHAIFKNAEVLYMKEISTLSLVSPAKPTIQNNGDVIMAIAKIGKGTVFAVGDPWLYNEYVDGRKLPAEFDNFQAAKDLTRWVIEQARSGRQKP